MHLEAIFKNNRMKKRAARNGIGKNKTIRFETNYEIVLRITIRYNFKIYCVSSDGKMKLLSPLLVEKNTAIENERNVSFFSQKKKNENSKKKHV